MTQTFDAKIRFGAEDTASPKIDSATQKILKDYRVLRQEQRAVRGEFELNNRALVDAGRAFRAVGSIASNLTSIYTKYNIMQLRISDANRRVRETQADYNRAIAESGPGSEEATKASRELADAKQDAARAQQEQTLGMIGFGFELASTVSLIISAIPKFKELAKTLGATQAVIAGTAGVSAATTAVSAATTAAATTTAAGAATTVATAATTGAVSKVRPPGGAGAGGIGAFFAAFLPSIIDTALGLVGDKAAQEREKQRQLESQAFQEAVAGKKPTVGVSETGQLVEIGPGGQAKTPEHLIIEIVNGTDQFKIQEVAKSQNIEVLVSNQ